MLGNMRSIVTSLPKVLLQQGTRRAPSRKALKLAAKCLRSKECEKKYGDRRAEFEEPCKLAVSQHFEELFGRAGDASV